MPEDTEPRPNRDTNPYQSQHTDVHTHLSNMLASNGPEVKVIDARYLSKDIDGAYYRSGNHGSYGEGRSPESTDGLAAGIDPLTLQIDKPSASTVTYFSIVPGYATGTYDVLPRAVGLRDTHSNDPILLKMSEGAISIVGDPGQEELLMKFLETGPSA